MVNYLKDAKHKKDFKFWVRFNTGEEGEIDLKEILLNAPGEMGDRFKNHPEEVHNFYLDPWPTLAWECGFDIAPERLYELLNHEGATQAAEGETEYETT